MAFFIKVHPTTIARREGYGIQGPLDFGYADNRDMIEYINDVRERNGDPRLTSNKMPREFSCSMIVPLKDGRSATAYVYEGNAPRMGNFGRTISSSKHRVFVTCPDCRADVPAGRTHQHKCKGN